MSGRSTRIATPAMSTAARLRTTNLGMVSADRGRLDAADCYFHESRSFAERVGDVHLWALLPGHHAEVHVARQRFEDARQNAESALALFDQLGVGPRRRRLPRDRPWCIARNGRPALAESRLRTAIDWRGPPARCWAKRKRPASWPFTTRPMGRNEEALRLLNTAYRLFRRLDARVDLVHVGGKVAELEGSYLALVREWGQSIESSDNYTYGHCERVARNAVAMARALGLGRARRDHHPARRLPPRPSSGTGAARDSHEGGPADAGGPRGVADAPIWASSYSRTLISHGT